MSRLENLVEDYATEPVPQAETYGGVRIGFILGGIGVALPALLSGAEVGVALGFEASLLAFLAAAVLVSTLAIVTGWVGMRSRLSTYMILRFSFGTQGARWVNLTFAIAQFGWFGVNAYFFGAAGEQIGEQVLGATLPSAAYVIGGGVLMTGATIFGFKALDKLALIAFPLMLTMLVMMVARTFEATSWETLTTLAPTAQMSFGQAVTTLSGGIIVGVLLVPDLTRYARGPRDVVVAVIIALTLIETLVHAVAAGPALHLGEIEPLAIMLALGFGAFALVFLVVASLTTNAVNLYGAGLSLASIFPRTSEWVFVVVAGVIGTAIALTDVSDVFIDFLVWQSVIFSSVLGVYVVDFFILRGGDYRLEQLDGAHSSVNPSAFIAWALGAVAAALAYFDKTHVTGIANLDGVLVAALVYGGLGLIRRREARRVVA
ncbi:MAG: cytosine permease [Pseudomonadota bacterium]